jgi:predicted membrane protein
MEDRKEKITDRLSTVYSLNRISIEEYERLIKYSQDIETEKELQILENLINGYNTEKKPENIFDIKPRENVTAVDNQPREQFTLLSSRKTTGPITSGNFSNILSAQKIIITEDDLINTNTTLNFSVILGEVIIHVPENVNVISKVMPILGEVSIANNVCESGGSKTLFITGNVILSEIKVKVKKK